MPYTVVERRAGDVASCYADPKLAAEGLKWKAIRGLSEMCKLTGSVDGTAIFAKSQHQITVENLSIIY